MLKSLSSKLFLNVILGIAVFCILQVSLLILLELREIAAGEPLAKELSELLVLVLISAGVLCIVASVFWFINKRLLHPLNVMHNFAKKVGNGFLDERIDGHFQQSEMQTLSNAFNMALESYAKANRSLKMFTGNASHQLRTPLTTIRTICDVTLKKSRTEEEYRVALSSLQDEAMHLSIVVEKLLMLAKMAPSTLQETFIPLNLTTTTIEAVNNCKASEENMDSRISECYADELTVMGDELMIRQAVLNILDNALSHSGESTAVSVKLYGYHRDAIIEISDEGLGFPEHIKISLDNYDNVYAHTGKGLGLVLASEIMRLHNGRLEVANREPHGCVVKLMIPVLSGSCVPGS